MKLFGFFFILGFLAQYNVCAQGSSNFQIWTDFNPSYNLGKKWKIIGDLGYRVETASNFHMVYIRPGIKFQPNKIIDFTGGVANFNSWDSGDFVKSEIRTFQFMAVAWPKIASFQFKHRLGLEQRWFYLAEFNLDEYVNRSRYYLEIKSPNFNLFKIKAPFFVTANLEILRDLNGNELGRLVDHNRYTIGVGNQITERLRAELRYKLINSIDPILNSYVRELNVLRIRLYYNFSST